MMFIKTRQSGRFVYVNTDYITRVEVLDTRKKRENGYIAVRMVIAHTNSFDSYTLKMYEKDISDTLSVGEQQFMLEELDRDAELYADQIIKIINRGAYPNEHKSKEERQQL